MTPEITPARVTSLWKKLIDQLCLSYKGGVLYKFFHTHVNKMTCLHVDHTCQKKVNKHEPSPAPIQIMQCEEKEPAE